MKLSVSSRSPVRFKMCDRHRGLFTFWFKITTDGHQRVIEVKRLIAWKFHARTSVTCRSMLENGIGSWFTDRWQCCFQEKMDGGGGGVSRWLICAWRQRFRKDAKSHLTLAVSSRSAISFAFFLHPSNRCPTLMSLISLQENTITTSTHPVKLQEVFQATGERYDWTCISCYVPSTLRFPEVICKEMCMKKRCKKHRKRTCKNIRYDRTKNRGQR